MSTSARPVGHDSEGSLTSRIRVAKPLQNSTPLDQESWPEYLRMQYPGATIIYDSGTFGDLKIRLPPRPTSNEDSNRLAHFLWDSSLMLSQLIAGSALRKHDSRWSVQGLRVLELGSGTGLVGMICALAGAERTVLTDYPSLDILENIRENVETNVSSREQIASLKQTDNISVEAHKWGEVEDDFAGSNAHKFTRVLATGCLFLPEQHENITKCMVHFLRKSEKAEIWVVSGFFLGREKLARFFDIAERQGLCVREVFEQNAVGDRREWTVDRGLEDKESIVEQGWLLVAVLSWSEDQSQECFSP